MIRLLCEINDTAQHARSVGAYALEDRLLDVYRRRYQQIIAAGTTTNPTRPRRPHPAVNLLARAAAPNPLPPPVRPPSTKS
jgi:hypothetical protein